MIKRLEERSAELARAIEQLKREIDERRRAEEALRQSEEKYRSLFENANDSIFIIDPSTRRLLDVNENAAKRLGYIRDELLGLSIDDIDTPMAAQRNDVIIRELLDNGSVTFEHAHLRKDGTKIPVEISSRVMEYGGRQVFQSIVRDITERKQAEKILQTSHHLLEIANRHMEMTLLLKEFLAEIRNFTGCAAVGLRVLDDEGNIPYQVYEGFCQRFYESENPLSINADQCMCINVIKGATDPKLPFYTEGGSFYMNGTTSFLATVSEEEKGQTRNVCNQFGYESVALAPIRLENRILGLVHVADPRENMVPLEMVEVLEGAAMQLGVAIQRVRVEEALQEAHDELERRVEERTAELKQEIKERKQAEEALRESEKQLRYLSSQLLTAQEKERKRIARELHDGIGQSLSAIKFSVENGLRQMDRETAGPIAKPLEAVIPMIQESIEEVRKIAMDLRPATLDDLGILATIAWFCREFETIYSGIRIEKKINIQENEVSDPLKTAIYRVLQEALNNVAKHSKANLANISLRSMDGTIELVVEDNGMGFDLKEALSVKSFRKGLGLSSMKERTELSGGSFILESVKGSGTIVRAIWKQ
jgi:PAS domain S-box-containing protein